MFEVLLLVAVLIIGFLTVMTDSLMRTVIFSGTFSLITAMAYVYYNAPDVALAEAAIGVGLATIMYLVAVKKVRVYDVLYINEAIENFDDSDIEAVQETLIRPLELFIEKTEELEPTIAYTNKEAAYYQEKAEHDFIICQRNNLTYLCGKTTDEVFQDIIANMNDILCDIEDIRVVYLDQEVTMGESE